MLKEDLLNYIRASAPKREAAVHYLLQDSKIESRILKFVLQNSGDKDDAKMIFHDAIIAFMKHIIKNPEFQLKQSHESYILGIAHNLWISKLRKRKLKLSSETPEELKLVDKENIAIDLLLKGELKDTLSTILSKMRQRCKEVLLYWADGYKMKEIAEMLGYKSEGMVRKKKSECLKELYTFLSNNQELVKSIRSY